MGILERSLAILSGLREKQAILHTTEDPDWLDTYTSAPAVGFVDPAGFVNKTMPQPRALALQLVNTGGGGTRTFSVTLHGTRRGRAQSETITVSGGGGATFNALGTKVFDNVGRYEVLVASGFTASDVWNIGFQNSDGSRYGLPIDVKSKDDIVGAMAGTGVTTVGTPIDMSTATVDVLDQSIRWTPALADSALVILTIRTSLK